ncbi:hypothetical protein ACPA9J_31465 [Pseudomonas aeruginosa]
MTSISSVLIRPDGRALPGARHPPAAHPAITWKPVRPGWRVSGRGRWSAGDQVRGGLGERGLLVRITCHCSSRADRWGAWIADSRVPGSLQPGRSARSPGTASSI